MTARIISCQFTVGRRYQACRHLIFNDRHGFATSSSSLRSAVARLTWVAIGGSLKRRMAKAGEFAKRYKLVG
jgi:hypothetical protein